jgi:hypothetical protein
MIEIDFQYNANIGSLEAKIQKAIHAKMTALVALMYDKLIANLSGKILHMRTGQLVESVYKDVEVHGNDTIGRVEIHPATVKAWTLEKGGKGFYPIVPVKADVLRWVDKGGQVRFAKEVMHPPSKEFAYMRSVAEEIAPMIEPEFKAAIDEVTSR